MIMKKIIIFTILFTSFLFVSCGNPKEEKEKLELSKEIRSIDSTAVVLQKTKNEIKKSSEKLDELLKNL